MKLIVTIDTEEDNWGSLHPTRHTVENIEGIPELQRLFGRYGVRPTYLVDYPVASHPRSVSVLKTIYEAGGCEIGVHCHPWNTPPFDGENSERNSMLCNIPGDLQFRKLQCLTETVVGNFNTTPVSFRAGRWGLSREVAVSLDRLGYRVDTSITPYTDWTGEHGPDFSRISLDPYYFNPEDVFKPVSLGRMLEVPATIGFIQSDFKMAHSLFEFLQRRPVKRFRLIGLLDKFGLLNKVWLSPEKCDSREMIALTERLIQKGVPLVNLFFHSPTLQPGLTPYVRTEADQKRFMAAIEEYLAFARRAGIESITLSDALKTVP